MSILQRVEQDIAGAVGRPQSSGLPIVGGPMLPAQTPIRPQSQIPGELVPLAANPPANVHPASYALGLKAGHDAALGALQATTNVESGTGITSVQPNPNAWHGAIGPGAVPVTQAMTPQNSTPLYLQ